MAQETIDTRIGKLTFESGYPSNETVQKLYDELDFQRACQAYIWGIPAVGLAEWRKYRGMAMTAARASTNAPACTMKREFDFCGSGLIAGARSG